METRIHDEAMGTVKAMYPEPLIIEPDGDRTITDEKLAERIIMDVTAKSAAWQGVDAATLTECYLIEQTLTATEEKREYYAYLPDGKAVLQRGNNGLYSYLSQELYDEPDGIYTKAVERTES